MGNLFIRWDDVNRTGLSIIDEQHRGLASLINSFYFHKNDPFIERILVPTALMTINFAKIHFLTEQQLMEEAAYPGLEEHTAAHEELLKELLIVEKKSRQARDADGFLDFLKGWWLGHVNQHDRLYIPHLQAFFGGRI